MTTSDFVILGLGVMHGINPGMGWLFAVGLGLQERDRRAVWRALLPLALGHALAIAAAVAVGLAVGSVLPVSLLKWVVAAALVLFGVDRLVRGRHPRWVGMRVGARDLTLWSLMMASAHGAGLMLLPFVLGGAAAVPTGAHDHQMAMMAVSLPSGAVQATLLHTAGYLAATGLVAVVVYEKLGLRLLGRFWFNLDLVWGTALIITGIVTPLL
ncbi:MAG: hypothetical protein ABI742_07790 [Gemmatimonadota bacterium]